jgi:hypothetical protein
VTRRPQTNSHHVVVTTATTTQPTPIADIKTKYGTLKALETCGFVDDDVGRRGMLAT